MSILRTPCTLALLSWVSPFYPRHAPRRGRIRPGNCAMIKRLGKLKDLNGYFPFTPSKSKEEWAVRREQVRRRILVANGLWPMPTKTPANAVVHGKVERDGYTVERVYLESYPGHFVTGSLYRPLGKTASCRACSVHTATGPTAASWTPASIGPQADCRRSRTF